MHDTLPTDSVLSYALESHLDLTGFYWYGGESGSQLRHKVVQYPKLNRGDCVAHHGQMLHAAPPQPKGSRAREAISFTFVDANARRLPPDHQRPNGVKIFDQMDGSTEDGISFMRWLNDIKPNGLLDHPLLPVVWPPSAEMVKTHFDLADLQGIIDTLDDYVEITPGDVWHVADDEELIDKAMTQLFSEEL